MKKNILSLIIVCSFLLSSAEAAILGSELVDSSSLLFGQSTTLHSNTFMSEQIGVGLQTEYYAEYTPNSNVQPVVVTGETLWGSRTAEEAVEYMKANNMYPMIGINASFFSFETGLPMGHVITDGIITSKDTRELDAIGFNYDGTGFISTLGIKTTANFGDYEFEIAHINKYSQETTQVMTLFTDDFGLSTKAKGESINVILGNVEGELSVGKTVTATVEDIKRITGETEIPEGKIVLTVNVSGNAWINNVLQYLNIGDIMTIKNEATSDAERWVNAYNGLASEGKRLVRDGAVAGEFEKGAAPRTAVGIKADGNIIFYVIDGRQPGYSYGVQQKTLAERMIELGCVDALNLDGGGSTTMSGIYPGLDYSSVINSPSEGKLRNVTNFIFLRNTTEPSGEVSGFYLYPYSTHNLAGTTVQIYTGAVDGNYHRTDVPPVTYISENEHASITGEGLMTLHGTGEAVITVTDGNASGSASYFTYETPTSLAVYNTETGKIIERLTVEANEVITLGGHSYYQNRYLNSTSDAYKWYVDSEIGSISDNGTLSVNSNYGAKGNVTVRAGEIEVKIPVEIKEDNVVPLDKYPYSETLVYNDRVRVDLFSYNQPIDMVNSYVKIDGNIASEADNVIKYEVDSRHSVIEIPVSAEFEHGYHKMLIKAQTTDGYASVQSDYVRTQAPVNIFADTTGHWAEDIVSFLNVSGVINGTVKDGKSVFNPDKEMTRAEFAVMMSNYMNVKVADYINEPIFFDDAEVIPEWAKNHIKAMAEMGIISGKQNGTEIHFAPADKITRAEAAAIIGRTLPSNLREGELKFEDRGDIPKWAYKNIAVLTNAKFMNGYPDNMVRPNKTVTRAEAAVMLYNVY